MEEDHERIDASLVSPMVSGWRRPVYWTLGILFVGLAWLGAFLPILPTTPFLLLASFFFVRSSPRWQERLLRSRLFGPFLADWNKHHGVRPRVKWLAIGTMVVVVSTSFLVGNLGPAAKGVLVALATIGLVVVYRLKTIRE